MKYINSIGGRGSPYPLYCHNFTGGKHDKINSVFNSRSSDIYPYVYGDYVTGRPASVGLSGYMGKTRSFRDELGNRIVSFFSLKVGNLMPSLRSVITIAIHYYMSNILRYF